ncbi:MAG: PaaI family thioesterase [Deltaproteobacteria bacterium]|nr:PaaI family thioesterase [Deltaproteobacteria bacterium]
MADLGFIHAARHDRYALVGRFWAGENKVNDGEINDIASRQPPFAKFLGMKIIHVSTERVTAELAMREELNNRFDIMHGGAIMALADNLGGTAATANLKDGQSTATIESKTNFFAAIPVGDTAYAECTPLHRGRTTMVWQTRITRGDGRLCALVTQTQMVLDRKK